MKRFGLVQVVAVYQLLAALIGSVALITLLGQLDAITIVFFVPITAMFGASGIGLLLGKRWGYLLSICLFIAQIVAITSPFSYVLRTMAYAGLVVGIVPPSIGVSGNFSLSLQFLLQFGLPYDTITVSINVFAMIVAIWLYKRYRRFRATGAPSTISTREYF